jgi:hypothetical protein
MAGLSSKAIGVETLNNQDKLDEPSFPGTDLISYAREISNRPVSRDDVVSAKDAIKILLTSNSSYLAQVGFTESQKLLKWLNSDSQTMSPEAIRYVNYMTGSKEFNKSALESLETKASKFAKDYPDASKRIKQYQKEHYEGKVPVQEGKGSYVVMTEPDYRESIKPKNQKILELADRFEDNVKEYLTRERKDAVKTAGMTNFLGTIELDVAIITAQNRIEKIDKLLRRLDGIGDETDPRKAEKRVVAIAHELNKIDPGFGFTGKSIDELMKNQLFRVLFAK